MSTGIILKDSPINLGPFRTGISLPVAAGGGCATPYQGLLLELNSYYNYSDTKPFRGLYNYSMSASIFPASSFGGARQIRGFQFYVRSWTTPYTVNNQEMWIGKISNSTFPASNPPTDFSDLTFIEPLVQVYSGKTITISTNYVWVNVDFDTPYCYDGTGNLLFVWKNLDGTWQSGVGQAQMSNIVSRGMYVSWDTGSMPATGFRDNYPLHTNILY